MRQLARLGLAVVGVILILLGALALYPPSDFTRFRWSWPGAAFVVVGVVATVASIRGTVRRGS